MSSHTASQRYLSTRGGAYDLGFEEVVLKGLAADGGLFIPEGIPKLDFDWFSKWRNLSFNELAFEIMSLYISSSEIPSEALKDIIERSYGTFRAPEVTPLIPLDEKEKLYLLELFHGPTFAFKDVALQFLGNLFEFFLVKRNEGKEGKERHHLTVIGATSGDTGSAAIYGLRGKKDVSVFILYPKGKVSPVQEAQMTTVLDANVHNLRIEGSFDDCQDIVKALFADPEINKTQKLAAVNSINWARILAQITYFFHAYFSLVNSPGFAEGSKIRFVVPTGKSPIILWLQQRVEQLTVKLGNFGDVLAGWFATRMGLPASKLVIATNSNDILDRFWKTGSYEKHPAAKPSTAQAKSTPASFNAAHPSGVIETLSPAMDILVSSNFERLLWFLSFDLALSSPSSLASARQQAGSQVSLLLASLKQSNAFTVSAELLSLARETFDSHRVSDPETIETIRSLYHLQLSPSLLSLTHHTKGTLLNSSSSYILDPHTAVGIAAARRSIIASTSTSPSVVHIALATAHPAKFADAVSLALKNEDGFEFAHVMPDEFSGLEGKEKRVRDIGKIDDLGVMREVLREEIRFEEGN